MRKRSASSRSALVYLIAVVALSSVDVGYEWFSPVASETGQSTDWCMVAGLRAGAVIVGNHFGGFANGLMADIHPPQLLPFPFYAGAGPDSGVVAVAVWFLAVVAWFVHWLWRLRARRLPGTRLGAPEK